MNEKQETRYTEDHEWIRMESDDVAVVGITHFAQEQLGDIVFVELPQIGRQLAANEEAAVIESVKAAAECKAPVAGTVVEVNRTLEDEPGKANRDPQGEGWFFKIRVANGPDVGSLMDEAAYQASVAE